MEIFTSSKSTVYIVTSDGALRKPDISEVEFADKEMGGNTVIFDGAITDQKIKKCRCNDDEIILEKTKDDVLKITTAYQAPKANYKSIIALAAQGNYGLELMRCENSRDTY
nr:hypothetical protein [Candidatus Brocadiales bacterium]